MWSPFAEPEDDVLLEGDFSGPVDHWGNNLKVRPGRGRQLLAPFLSIEVAQHAIQHGYDAVVTGPRSLACHGANLLRAARRNSQFIGWKVTRSSETDAYSGAAGHETSVLAEKGELQCKVIRIDGVDADPWTCYWPDRFFDLLTVSAMLPGLKRSAQFLVGGGSEPDVKVVHGQDNRIWFCGSLSQVDIWKKIKTWSSGERVLREMVAVYAQILEQMDDRQQVRPSRLPALLEDYFSVFLPYHSSYTGLVSDLSARLDRSLARVDRDKVMTEVCVPSVVSWQQEQDIVLKNKKDILVDEWRFVLPPGLSILEDSARMLHRVHLIFHTFQLPMDDQRQLEYVAQVMVAKEWKFVLNKMLFSQVARLASGLHLSEEATRRLRLEKILSTRPDRIP